MKVLLITYWFPPAKAIGAKRWGEFYKLSQEDNEIDITVLTANWQGHDASDKHIVYVGEEVHSKPFFSINKPIGYVEMLKHPSLMIRSLDRSLQSDWYKASKIWLDNNAKSSYDLVISSFGPISSVLLGNHAKKIFNTPHVVDLRDLVSIQGQKNRFPMVNFLDKQIDKFIMREVNEFLVVSPTGHKKASEFYKRKVTTIYNGLQYKIEEKEINLTVKNRENIEILYMGTLGINRNPYTILALLNEYAKEHDKVNITVKFASQDDPFNFIGKEIIEHIEVLWLGYLGVEELEEEKEKSNIFLLLEDLTPKGNENLTGKIFEYLYSQKPIMLSCHRGSDIVKLLNETSAGSLVERIGDVNSFVLEERYLEVEKCNYYTRENQYKLLKETIGVYDV